jgi:N-glycosylase/DNA lyase
MKEREWFDTAIVIYSLSKILKKKEEQKTIVVSIPSCVEFDVVESMCWWYAWMFDA